MEWYWFIVWAACGAWGVFTSAVWKSSAFDSLKDFWIVVSFPIALTFLVLYYEKA